MQNWPIWEIEFNEVSINVARKSEVEMSVSDEGDEECI